MELDSLSHDDYMSLLSSVLEQRLAKKSEIEFHFGFGKDQSLGIFINRAHLKSRNDPRHVRQVSGWVTPGWDSGFSSAPVTNESRNPFIDENIHDIMRAIANIKTKFRALTKYRGILRVEDSRAPERLAAMGGTWKNFQWATHIRKQDLEKALPAWHRKRNIAARRIQKHWLPAYYNPRSRTGKDRLLREFNQLESDLKKRRRF